MIASNIVSTGPTEPITVVRVTPIRMMASLIMKLGMTGTDKRENDSEDINGRTCLRKRREQLRRGKVYDDKERRSDHRQTGELLATDPLHRRLRKQNIKQVAEFMIAFLTPDWNSAHLRKRLVVPSSFTLAFTVMDCVLMYRLNLRVCLLVACVASSANAAPPKVSTKKDAPAKKPPAPFAWVNPIPAKQQLALLKHGTFTSSSLDVEVGYAIQLPPSYSNRDSNQRFPVVYYLHGGRPGSETKSIGLAPKIAESMESKQVREMIYVFVNGGPVSHYNIPNEPTKQGANVFIHELIPHIDSTYRTMADREHRGIEGFSQGGRGTMRLSLRYPELFCSAAAGGGGYETERLISASGGRESETLVFAKGDNTWDLARDYANNRTPKVNWMIYVGTQCFNYENNLAYMKFLESLEIPHRKIIVPDAKHSASEVYETKCLEIMQFHANNFGESR